MIERSISFDGSCHSLDAIQRAAYRFSDRIAIDASQANGSFEVKVQILAEDADPEALLAAFRNEVLDQVLRDRIRAETEEVRQLALALAFSRTGLAGEADADV